MSMEYRHDGYVLCAMVGVRGYIIDQDGGRYVAAVTSVVSLKVGSRTDG